MPMNLSPPARIELYDALKGIAIVTVLFCHVNLGPRDMAGWERLLFLVQKEFSFGGVPLFFIVSGLLFERSRKTPTVGEFLVKQGRRLVVPLLVCGTAVYVFSMLGGAHRAAFSFTGWLLFVLGYKSLFYFVPALLALQVLFVWLRRRDWLGDRLLWGAVATTVITVLAYFADFRGWLSLPPPLPSLIFLNPLCWVGFLALGVLIGRRLDADALIAAMVRRRWPVLIAGAVVLLLATVDGWQGWGYAYFKPASLAWGVLFPAAAVVACDAWRGTRVARVLVVLGAASLSIYLTHMPLAGALRVVAARADVESVLWNPLGVAFAAATCVAFAALVRRVSPTLATWTLGVQSSAS
jgi:peptidoglycan/LPS O-acetylase OafA/YrhL